MSSNISLLNKRPFSGPIQNIDDDETLRITPEITDDVMYLDPITELNHRANDAEKAPKNEKCSECKKKFSNRRNLKRHYLQAHPGKNFSQEQKAFKYNCEECPRNFNYMHHLKAHMRGMHGRENLKIVPKLHKCFMCSMEFERKILFSHYETEHSIEIEQQELSFSNIGEFLSWKDSFEKETKSKYIVERGVKKHAEKICHFYRCHRSGNFEPNSTGLRSIKQKGSKKINYLCPSSMKLVESADGMCNLKLIKSHIGHKSELVYLQLTLSEREKIAEKLAVKIPLDVILDDVRDSISKRERERIHLLTKQDLYNIERSFNLNCNIQKDSDDGVSIDIWVREVKESDDNCILLYKPQGVLLSDEPDLKSNDFALIIMNDAQKEMLKKYGSDSICIDGTHSLNPYKFELFTLLVIDDMREGFPCAFFFCNRSDEGALSVFYRHIKSAVGCITANIFMSDMANAFYNAWVQVMSPPEHFLYCTWHVDHAWRRNLNKIKKQENKVHVYKILRTVLEELDETAFQLMIKAAVELLSENTDTQSFARYFDEHYVSNVKRWAFCYRRHCGLNTNMHLERMHRTIKHIYLEGKVVKRLDKALHALMRFLRNKIVDRIIMFEKGKISTKLKYLRSRHRNSIQFNTVIAEHEGGWNVQSEGHKAVYFVEESSKTCPSSCKLVCNECDVCIHKYICTCADSAIKWNMCKHIHKVCMLLKEENSSSTISEFNCRSLSVCDSNDETDFLTQQLDKSHTSTENLEDEIEKVKADYLDVFQSLNKRQLDFMKKNLLYIKATLPSLKEEVDPTSSLSSPNVINVSQNKNINPQRRLYPTKKLNPSKKLNMVPSSDEKDNIAMTLILKSQDSDINL